MRILRAYLLMTSLCLAPAARADLPSKGEMLAAVEAFADACVEFDPAQAQRYQTHLKTLLGPEATEQALAKVRESADYKKAYAEAAATFRKGPKETVVKQGCPSFLLLKHS